MTNIKQQFSSLSVLSNLSFRPRHQFSSIFINKSTSYLNVANLAHPVQGAAFSIVLRGTEKTVIDRKKVAHVFWSLLAFENWSFWNLLCISFAIKVIKKGKTVSGRTMA